jgi:Sulfotransferase domain
MALQVIGAGFGRTGTLSLKLALERLGVGHCYHMLEFRQCPAHVPLWGQVADGRQDPWDAIFERYRASFDGPGCRFWRDLATYYPDAKVVLTIRGAVVRPRA